MEPFSKDEIILLGLSMDLPELLTFCRLNKRINSLVCDNNDFWRRKIEKDRPGVLEVISNYDRDQNSGNNSENNIKILLNYKGLYRDLQQDDIFYIPYSETDLKIYGVIKGNYSSGYQLSERYDNDRKIGDKVWVLVNNHPEYLIEHPQLYNTREGAIRDIYNIINWAFIDTDEDMDAMTESIEKQLLEGDYVEIILEHSNNIIKFRIEELTIL